MDLDASTKEPRAMAKVQKSLLIHEDLAALLDEYQGETGISFTQVVTASILSFLFDGLDKADVRYPVGPNTFWMMVASKLSRGSVTIDDLPNWIVNTVLAEREEQAKIDEAKHGEPNKEILQKIEQAKGMLSCIAIQLEALGGDKRKLVMAMLRDQEFLLTSRTYRSPGE